MLRLRGNPAKPGGVTSDREAIMTRRLGHAALAAVFIAGLATTGASAQTYPSPSRPITIMVGLAAGGITDVTTRVYAEVVSRKGCRVEA